MPAPAKPRPVVLNTWEAVYFDHNLATLIELADSAAELGVERFVLDDGWFRGRRDDHAGLGDWYVDETLWPDGLTPLIDAVTSRGMEFGLWVEPEMVNLDSDIVRAHPEWIVGPSVQSYKDGGRLPLEWRHQHIIDLVNPEAWQYIYDRDRRPAARKQHQLPQVGPEPGPARARPRRPRLRPRTDPRRLPAVRRTPQGPSRRRD